MWKAVMTACAATALLSVPVWAADLPTRKPSLCPQPPGCAFALFRPDLATVTQLTRDVRERLIRNPGDIGAVVAEGDATTDLLIRAQIELGVVLAIEYLARYDERGYQVIVAYMEAHPDEQVVQDIRYALCALGQTPPTPSEPPAQVPPPTIPGFPPGEPVSPQ